MLIEKIKGILNNIPDIPNWVLKCFVCFSMLATVVFVDMKYLLWGILLMLFIIETKIDKLK